MKPGKSPARADASEDVTALIEVLHKTGQRLEELTAGEVDTVADRKGRTFMLRHAQDELRHSDAAKQAAILNALPAHIALLDTRGVIISVNDAWRRFGRANVIHGPGYAIGVNYLDICDSAPGDGTSEPRKVAEGIRAVLSGRIKTFSIEYASTPPELCWFRLTITPLGGAPPRGAVVMHLDVTAERQTEESLRTSESRFRQMAENIHDVFSLVDAESNRVLYVSQAYEEIWGRTCASLYANPESWTDAVHVEDRESVLRNHQEASKSGRFDYEYRIVRPDGEIRWIRARGYPIKNPSGTLVRIAGIAADISQRRMAEEKISRLNRVYAVLSRINALIVHVHERQAIFDEACRIAVEHGNFGMAWIGVLDPETQDVTPVAWAGEGAEEITRGKSSGRDDTPRGKGAVGRAIRERRPMVNNDIAAHTFGGMRAQTILRLGFQSQVTLPLYEEQTLVATLTMYAREPGFFDEKEVALLAGLAGDISFALENIRRQEKHDKLARIRAVSSEINAAIIRIHDREALLRETCRIAVEHGKFEMVWIGLLDPAKQRVQAVAWEGFPSEIANSLTWASLKQPGATMGEVIQTRKVAMRNEIDTAMPAGKLRGHAMRQGYRSSVCVPFMVDGNVVAALSLFVTVREFFDEEELSLLNEVSADVSFALQAIEKNQLLRVLNRVYAMLSGITTLIVHVRDRDELFREACRIAVEAGGFRMAWIGIVDRRAMKIVQVASAGGDPELLSAIKDRFSRSEAGSLGTSMAARAIIAKKPVLSNDLQSDPKIAFGKQYTESGIRSIALLPLVVSGEGVGVLALHASEVEFFHEEELKLLTDLTYDIAFAIDHIDKQDRMSYLAYYDVLTGLANRHLFLERLEQCMRDTVAAGHKLAVYLIDLERFKNINDSLGQPAGDALLKQVAEWLTRNVGDANLLARVGADQFAVMRPQVKEEGDAARLLEKMVSAFLEHSFRLNDVAFRIAAKIGITLFPDDGADAATLFRNAEAALKKAKTSGDRYLFYTQKMTETVAGKLTLENQLRQALGNEEFVLHYQPKVNLESGKVTGAEALIRWNDPRTGLVPPGQFIPILEETGLIYEVGRWALRKAIEDYLHWRAAGLPAVPIAVNVSPLQLRNRGFVAEIEHAIGVDAQAAAGLELEITESLIMEDVAHTTSTLRSIRDMGVSIAIDDFGTGFSSLSYLSKLPVDTLKIDRSFVNDMTAAPEGLALMSTIISLAHSLKLKVVAEGVETEEQSRLLRLLKCDEMQGFLFSKPLPIALFEERYLAALAVTA